jgi:hypothetical protein
VIRPMNRVDLGVTEECSAKLGETTMLSRARASTPRQPAGAALELAGLLRCVIVVGSAEVEGS